MPKRRAAVAKRVPPTERRRAPEPVLLAREAAGRPATMAGREPATLACVFTSTHGDLAITDAMCATLAADPRELSPTRFHNSVHNAPAGYWTVAAHCHRPRPRSAPGRQLRARASRSRTEVDAEGEAVLLAAYDIAARGPLAEVAPSTLRSRCIRVNASRSAASLARFRFYRCKVPEGDRIDRSASRAAANPTAGAGVSAALRNRRGSSRRSNARVRRDNSLRPR